MRRRSMLFYFDHRTWRRMLRLAWAEPSRARRRSLLLLIGGLVPAVACFHAVCFFLDRLLFPRLRSVEVRAPVFIVGHARSGTTLLHRLMSKDEERFSFFLLYEMFFPSLLQKKAIRALAAYDRRWLGSRIERRVAAWDRRKFSKTADMHATGLTAPEEDDFVLAFSCASGAWIVALPYMGLLDFYYVDDRPARERRRLMRFYAECVKRELYLNGPHKSHLSKNPTFSGRVATLLETFPDARIVVAMRNPYETIPSLLKLMQRSWKLRRWDDAQARRSLRALAEQSYHTYRYPLEVLACRPETRHALVDYRELVAEPARTVERVYERLGFEMSAAMRETLAAEQARARGHESAHAYSLEEFGLDAGEVRSRLADLFEAWRWDGVGAGERGAGGAAARPRS